MIKIETNIEEVVDALGDWARDALNALESGVKEHLLNRISAYLASSTIRKISSNVPPPNASLTKNAKGSDKTLQDTGRLKSSITYVVRGSNEAEVGTNVEYAAIQHFGGDLEAKNARYLCIPASKDTKRLMRRYGASARSLIMGLRASGWSVWKAGNTIQARRSNRSSPQTLFILKEKVSIPARPFLYCDEKDKTTICDIIKRFLKIVF